MNFLVALVGYGGVMLCKIVDLVFASSIFFFSKVLAPLSKKTTFVRVSCSSVLRRSLLACQM